MSRACIALFGGCAAIALSAGVALGADDSLAIFQRRILPILSAKDASSCSECHLSGVDLKDYIRPTQDETFAALKGAGLIDLAKPDASKLLAFIARKPDKPSLITDKVRQEEYKAFRAWIAAAVKDPALAKAKTTDGTIGPDLPEEVIRHAGKDRVLSSFLDNVWSEVARCAACHSPDRNQQQVKKHGEHISLVKLGDPQATLDHLREHELLDLKSPEKSLFLLKPLNQVMHGGGQKMAFGDRTYQQFRGFIEDLAATEAGRYQSADQLPEPPREQSIATGIWLKITGVPAKFDKLVLQADVYRWDERTRSWSTQRCATGDRPIAGDRQLWQQHLSLVAPRESERAAELRRKSSLPAGKYLVRIYVDQENKLEKEFPTTLGAAELVGEVEVTSSWPEGYGSMTVVRFPLP
jgi:mono/diheme cytochrome c family protein